MGGNVQLPDNKSLVLGNTNPVSLHNNSAAPELWLEATGQASSALVIGTAFDPDKQVKVKYAPGAVGAAAGELRIGQDVKLAGAFTHGITTLYTNGAERLRIDATGNVIIGTGHLKILGLDTFLDFGTDMRQMLNLGNGCGIGVQTWTQYIRSTGNFAWYIGGAHNDAELNAGGGTVAMVIKRVSGNVGIGTPSPDDKLDVEGNIRINDNNLWLRGATDLNHAIGYYGGSKPFANTSIDGPAVFGWSGGALGTTSGGQKIALYWNSAGNVGIGTASPQQNLSVNGAMNLDQANANSGTVSSALTFGSGSGEAIASKRTAGGNQFGLDFYTASINRMSITNGGNVGIGTTNPQSRLDVTGGDIQWGNHSWLGADQGGSIELGGDNSTPGKGTPYIDFHFKGLTQDFNTRIINDDNGRLFLQANTLYTSGNVGIGTSGPVNKLDVNGDIAISGKHAIRGNDGWLRLNQDGAFASGVHTPGVFAPMSLNVGGANSWGNPGAGNVWVTGSQKITGRLGTNGYDPNSGYPGGWGGGIHTWDIAAHGTGRAVSGWQSGNWDLAEKFEKYDESLEPGDVVVADTSSSERLIKSTYPYQDNLLGVISEKPGFLLGVNWEDPQYPIALALAGRVKVKINMEGGPVMKGDYLTSSSEESYAMKANRSGRVIGIALESFDVSQGSKGKVVVFVNPHWWGGYNRRNT